MASRSARLQPSSHHDRDWRPSAASSCAAIRLGYQGTRQRPGPGGGGPAGPESVDADPVFDRLARRLTRWHPGGGEVSSRPSCAGGYARRNGASMPRWPGPAAPLMQSRFSSHASDGPVTLSLSGSWSPQQVRLQLDGGSLELAVPQPSPQPACSRDLNSAPKDLTIAPA